MTELQVALSAALTHTAQTVVEEFDFRAAVKYMLATQYDWVDNAVQDEKRCNPAFDEKNIPAAFLDHLVFRAQGVVSNLVNNAIADAVSNVARYNYSGCHYRRYGFSIVIRLSGYVDLFFAPTYSAASHWEENQDNFWRRFRALYTDNQRPQPVQHGIARQPFDSTPGKRKLLLLQE